MQTCTFKTESHSSLHNKYNYTTQIVTLLYVC